MVFHLLLRFQYLSSGGQLSGLLSVNVSLPQMSILGRLLFTFFIEL
jgi:hypothetical protein